MYKNCFLGAYSIKCLVGQGDIYETPASAQDIENGEYPSMDAPFKSIKCGERGSQIQIISTVIKNVTDTIEQSWTTFTESITSAFEKGENRSKR